MIRVIIADDHTIVREGIRMILNRVPEVTVVAEASNGREAVALVNELKPDVVVMDVIMPELDGIEAAGIIKRENPDTEIIALSMYSDRCFISEMLKAGARGFLLKDCASTELTEALYAVRNGDVYLGPSVSEIVAKLYVDAVHGLGRNGEGDGAELSPRESEIAKMLAEGRTNAEIAGMLHVSVKMEKADCALAADGLFPFPKVV